MLLDESSEIEVSLGADSRSIQSSRVATLFLILLLLNLENRGKGEANLLRVCREQPIQGISFDLPSAIILKTTALESHERVEFVLSSSRISRPREIIKLQLFIMHCT